jgi:hypothetical protein
LGYVERGVHPDGRPDYFVTERGRAILEDESL